MKPKTPKPITLDFETEPVGPRPLYPPKPVGFSLQMPGKKPRYYSWGHPTKNNCTFAEAKAALHAAWNSTQPILCHNAKFDVDVAETHMGCKPREWASVHDTMFLLFLLHPHNRSHKLKEVAEQMLGMKPEERDEVRDWLIDNKIMTRSQKETGKYIYLAPGDLVGKYANGDCDRTIKLFNKLYPEVVELGMLPAYDRERQLIPILLEMERRGVPVDVPKLKKDTAMYRGFYDKATVWIQKRIGVASDFNIDGKGLMDALIAAGMVDESKLNYTEKGNVETGAEALEECMTDDTLRHMMKWRGQMGTALGTFMEAWLATATLPESKGRIFTTWHQTKGSGKGGTRTGRFSSSPNWQNIPNEFKPLWKHEIPANHQDPKMRELRKKLPACPIKGLPALPLCREYIIAPPGWILFGRDFASQELRVLAHFEDAEMLEAYQKDPDLDLHAYAAKVVTAESGVPITRKDAKAIAFGLLYGLGVGSLAEKLGCDVKQAKRVRDAYLNTFPGVRELIKTIQERGKSDLSIKTLGGRLYQREPSKMINGRMVDFSYKLVNYLIQGSSADMTKDAMIEHSLTAKHGVLLIQVHDELVGMARTKDVKKAMLELKNAMHGVPLDAPIRSDGEVGVSWGHMEEVKW